MKLSSPSPHSRRTTARLLARLAEMQRGSLCAAGRIDVELELVIVVVAVALGELLQELPVALLVLLDLRVLLGGRSISALRLWKSCDLVRRRRCHALSRQVREFLPSVSANPWS